jgi:hypothetical protein
VIAEATTTVAADWEHYEAVLFTVISCMLGRRRLHQAASG